MGWLKELGKDSRGSRPRCVLLTDGSSDRVAGRLTRLIHRPEIEVSPGDQWQPYGTSDVREAQLDKAWEGGAALLPEAIRRQLSEWWLAAGAGRVRTLNWDIASTCTVSGRKGLLLVEAKAHSTEVSKNDRSGATPANRKRIEGCPGGSEHRSERADRWIMAAFRGASLPTVEPVRVVVEAGEVRRADRSALSGVSECCGNGGQGDSVRVRRRLARNVAGLLQGARWTRPAGRGRWTSRAPRCCP